ncbi:MAG: sec-independent protein translocase protein TatB [Paracoccaceae bacterium]|jgi:sec-independent protein translocase protein TatB
MLDIGGWEFLLIAILGIMIIGPKELPGAIRTVSMFVRRARGLARDFQSGLEEVARDAELDTLTDDIKGIAGSGDDVGNFRDELQDAVDPDGNLKEAMDFQTDWSDDDLIDYDDPEFADDNRIAPPDQKTMSDAPDAEDAPDDGGTKTAEASAPETAAADTAVGTDVTPKTEVPTAGDADPAPVSDKKPDGAS